MGGVSTDHFPSVGGHLLPNDAHIQNTAKNISIISIKKHIK